MDDQLLVAMANLTMSLEEKQKFEELFDVYRRASQSFPDEPCVWNSLGSQLFRFGFVDEAATCFGKALSINPTYLAARENLENIHCHLIERWHFRMVNDELRNRKYLDAMCALVSRGASSVLDIGAGTGLLSMYALMAGAENVFACELNKTMYQLCLDVLAANKMNTDITLFQKHSSDLHVGQGQDLPDRVNLVVTEIFDAGLLGEHILPTLQHSWKHLLKPPPPLNLKQDSNRPYPVAQHGHVIPESAVCFLSIIECENLRKHTRFVLPGLRYVDLSAYSFVSIIGNTNSEDNPYTSDRLYDMNYRQLCDTEQFRIDFNDPEAIDKLLNGETIPIEFLINQNGRADAICACFKLNLDGENFLSNQLLSADSLLANTETTKPTIDSSQQRCWEQAIYPIDLSEMHPTSSINGACYENKPAKSHRSNLLFSGDKVTAEITCSDHMDIRITSCTPFRLGYNLETEKITLTENQVFYLNDTAWNNMWVDVLTKWLTSRATAKELRVLVLTHNFSFIPIQILKLVTNVALVSIHGLPDHLVDVLRNVAVKNNVRPNRIEALADPAEIDRSFDLVLLDPIEVDGTVSQRVLEDFAMCKFTKLKPNGSILPPVIEVYGCLIECSALREDALVVSNGRTMGLDIAKHINEFYVSNHRDFGLSVQKTKGACRLLSAPFELLRLNLNESPDEPPSFNEQLISDLPVRIQQHGRVDALVYWFRLDFPSYPVSNTDSTVTTESVSSQSDNVVTPESVACSICDDTNNSELSAAGINKLCETESGDFDQMHVRVAQSSGFSTIDSEFHFKQGAYIFPRKHEMKCGSAARLFVHFRNGYFAISFM